MDEGPGARETGNALQRSGKTVPLYAQVAQLIRQRIYRRGYKTGDMLPSETVLSGEYQVSLETVRKALGLLRGEGTVVTDHGVGTRVAHVASRVTVAARPGDIAESRMPTPPERQQLGMPEGVPVVVLVHPDGREEVFDSIRTRIVFGDLTSS